MATTPMPTITADKPSKKKLEEPIVSGSALDVRNQLYGNLLGRPLDYGDVASLGGQGSFNARNPSYTDQYNEIIGSQEFADVLRGKAAAQYQPTLNNELATVDLAKQAADVNRAEAIRKISEQNLGLNLQEQIVGENERSVNRQYDRLGETLVDTATKNASALQERMNQLGLLQSGSTAAGLGDIQKTLTRSQVESEQDRASKLAQMAIQRSGIALNRSALAADVGDVERRYDIGSQQLGNQAMAAKVAYQQNIDNAVQKLLQGYQETGQGLSKAEVNARQQELDNALAVAKFADTIPAGQVVELPGFGQVVGTAEPTRRTQITSVGNRQVLVDLNTGQPIADLGPVSRAPSSPSVTETRQSSQKTDLQEAQTKLQDSVDKAPGGDRYFNTEVYRQALRDFTIKYPGYEEVFYAAFPPEDVLNPKDPTAAGIRAAGNRRKPESSSFLDDQG